MPLSLKLSKLRIFFCNRTSAVCDQEGEKQIQILRGCEATLDAFAYSRIADGAGRGQTNKQSAKGTHDSQETVDRR